MELCEQHGINVVFAVPTQLATLLDHPEFDPQRLTSLKYVAFGGAPLAKPLIERIEKAMPWFECCRAYGSTETGHLAAQVKADREYVFDGFNNPGGRLEIELFKSPGVVAELGEVGEIATRGPHLFTRYLDNDAAMQEFFKTDETAGDWGWMGDQAEKCEGFFRIIGRSKNMILSGGLNIYPTELEEILIGHAEVLDCVVFGIDDDTWGELPAAAVVTANENIKMETLMEYVASKVARYKRIRQMYSLDDIPRTAAGKVQTERVKAMCLEEINDA
jgi:fatty-acyl-CoA synthase